MEKFTDNRYQTERWIGGGGMAEVYLAHDEVLDRDVALKVLREQYAEDEDFIERFKREARSAAALSHPNVVQIYDRGAGEDGSSFIAMEYIAGGTLKDRLRRDGALEAEQVAEVSEQIAAALEAAHARDLVHRDIKPQNILVTETGDVKVTDFGIARAASETTATATGVVLGTAHYISPEQAQGVGASARSDLYSLGIVMYEMLTGELPFEADTPVAIAVKHVNEPPRPPREINPDVPEHLDAIVQRLLAKDPQHRYPNASELIRDLQRFQRGGPVSRETTRMAAVAAPVGVAGGAKNSDAPEGAGENDRGPMRREEHERRRRRGGGKLWPMFISAVFLLAVAGIGFLAWNTFFNSPTEDQLVEPGGTTVPNLEGLLLENARDALGEEFTLAVDEERNSPEPEETILGQDPQPGSELPNGEEISVDVSTGVNEVPDVTGIEESEAREALEEAGFEVQTRNTASDSAPEDEVITQTPEGGEDADVESTVVLMVSSGPAESAAEPQQSSGSQDPAPGGSTPSSGSEPSGTAPSGAPSGTPGAATPPDNGSSSGDGSSSGNGSSSDAAVPPAAPPEEDDPPESSPPPENTAPPESTSPPESTTPPESSPPPENTTPPPESTSPPSDPGGDQSGDDEAPIGEVPGGGFPDFPGDSDPPENTAPQPDPGGGQDSGGEAPADEAPDGGFTGPPENTTPQPDSGEDQSGGGEAPVDEAPFDEAPSGEVPGGGFPDFPGDSDPLENTAPPENTAPQPDPGGGQDSGDEASDGEAPVDEAPVDEAPDGEVPDGGFPDSGGESDAGGGVQPEQPSGGSEEQEAGDGTLGEDGSPFGPDGFPSEVFEEESGGGSESESTT